MSGTAAADEKRDRLFTRRACLLGLGQLAGFGLLGGRLYQLQVQDGPRYAALADENRIGVEVRAPLRGRILDRYGVVLASNRETYRVALVPSLAGNLTTALERLSMILPLTDVDRQRLLARARRQPAHMPLIVAGDLTFEQIAAVGLQAPRLPGLVTEGYGRREYPLGATTAHVIGHVGSHDKPALDDDPVLRIPGIRIGKSGIELGADERLRGRGGLVRHEVDARGRIVRRLERIEPQPGADVTSTIDATLQLELSVLFTRERRAAMVALDVEGGEVVAMVSQPTFDPAALIRDKPATVINGSDNPQLNRTTAGLYPPGSTFKMVTALAALQAGVVDVGERIECTGSYGYAGQTFRCWRRSGHGHCDLHRALTESCDCYFYEVARRVGIGAIAAMGRRLGLGQALCQGFGPEKTGVLPTPEWKRSRSAMPWLGGETILAGIGQGYVLATPMQLAVMTARLASGRAVRPTLVQAATGPASPPAAALGLDRRSLDAVRRAMRAVVNDEGGTGGRARLESDEDLMAGKTGTSQVGRRSADTPTAELDWDERDHALFVGYAPIARPRYALAVVVEHAGGGGAAAAPLAREVMQLLLERDPIGRGRPPETAVGAVRRAGRG